MTPKELTLLVTEVAAGVLVQATDLRGPLAAVVASTLIITTLAALVVARIRHAPLSHRIERFLAERRDAEPYSLDAATRIDHDADTLYCYRPRFETEVRDRVRQLRAEGILGPNEAGRLTNPATVADIQRIAARLSNYERPC